ncbi:MAG: extracellular solute-binding protein [Chloroflexota bacterium]
MFKRLTLLMVALLVLVTGVSVFAQDDVIEIEYWQYNFGARVTAMDALIEQFEAANPDINVLHNNEIPYDNFRDEIAASAPAGVGPDVVTLFYGWIPAFVDAGYLVPLPEPFTQEYLDENFVPMVAGSASFEGEIWAVPTAVRALALFYNTEMLAEAGYDAPPATLDELVKMAQATVIYDGEPSVDNITTQGFAPQFSGQWHHWYREVLFRQYDGGQPYSDDNREVLWNTEAGCEAFTWMTQFETEWMTGGQDLFTDADDSFVNGQSALHIDGSFRLGTIANNNPELPFAVAELPLGPNGEQHTYGSYWTHGITRRAAADEARLEASTRFLEFVTSPEAGKLWVAEVGELPAQIESANDPDLLEDPLLAPFLAGLNYSHATFFVDETQQRQHLIDAFDLVRLSGLEPCEALAEAAALEQDLLDEFWEDRE